MMYVWLKIDSVFFPLKIGRATLMPFSSDMSQPFLILQGQSPNTSKYVRQLLYCWIQLFQFLFCELIYSTRSWANPSGLYTIQQLTFLSLYSSIQTLKQDLTSQQMTIRLFSTVLNNQYKKNKQQIIALSPFSIFTQRHQLGP